MLDLIHRYETKIEFSKIGHDLSLDFVKGICILLVVINHCIDSSISHNIMFWLWGYPAVPLFLLIQVYHSYKKEFDGIHIQWVKIWKRAFFPFNITFYCDDCFLLGRERAWFLLSVDIYPVCDIASLTSPFISTIKRKGIIGFVLGHVDRQ